MIELRIDGKLAEIPANLEFSFVIENPYFTDASEYTEEIELYPKSPRNAKIFGTSFRHEKSKNKLMNDCELRVNNKIILRGKSTTTEFSDRNIKIQLLGGNSAVNYLIAFDKIYIDEMEELGNLIDSWAYLKHNLSYPDFQTFVHYTMSAPEECEFVMLPAYDKDDDEIRVNHFAKYFVNEEGTDLDYGYPCPIKKTVWDRFALQPRLTAIVRRIIKALGYEITEFDAENTPLKYLYYVNVVETLKLNEMLPHWTVSQFLDEIQKLFSCVFIFDTKKMKCKIKSRNRFFVDEIVELKEVDDRFTVNFNDESIDISDSNLKYEADDFNKVKLFDEIANKKAKFTEVNDMSRIEKLLLEGNSNLVCCVDDRYYIRHEEKEEIENEDGTFTEKINYSIEEANHLGIKYDINKTNYVGLKIIPAEIKEGRIPIIGFGQNNLPDFTDEMPCVVPVGIPPTKSSAFNIDRYVHESVEEETNSLDVMPIAVFTGWNMLPEIDMNVRTKESDPTIIPGDRYPDEWMYVSCKTKLWCGWTYHVDDVVDFKKYYPYIGFDHYSDKLKFNPTLALRNIKGWDTLYSLTIATTKKIETKNSHQITFYDNIDINNINKVFLIRGKKYLCEKVELIIDNKGINKAKVGTFYRID